MISHVKIPILISRLCHTALIIGVGGTIAIACDRGEFSLGENAERLSAASDVESDSVQNATCKGSFDPQGQRCGDASSVEECDVCLLDIAQEQTAGAPESEIALQTHVSALQTGVCTGPPRSCINKTKSVCEDITGCYWSAFGTLASCKDNPYGPDSCGGKACNCSAFKSKSVCDFEYSCSWTVPSDNDDSSSSCTEEDNRCIDEGARLEYCVDGTMKTKGCSPGYLCSGRGQDARCSKADKIQEGLYHYSRDGRTRYYYTDGRGRYCEYEDFDVMECSSSYDSSDAYGSPYVDPRDWEQMTDDGVCGRSGCTYLPATLFSFRDNTVAIYHSNGRGHYCGYRNWRQFECLTGGSSSLREYYNRTSWTAMMYDGYCWSERCSFMPEGIFRDQGAGVFYSNGQGHYCHYRNMTEFRCLSGRKYPNGTPRRDISQWPAMEHDGACWSSRCSGSR